MRCVCCSRSSVTRRHRRHCCNALQHTATHCNTLQRICVQSRRIGALYIVVTRCNTLQHAATHCNTPMCFCVVASDVLRLPSCRMSAFYIVVTRCNTLQRTRVFLWCCRRLVAVAKPPHRRVVYYCRRPRRHVYRLNQCVALCCSVCQCFAVCFGALQLASFI